MTVLLEPEIKKKDNNYSRETVQHVTFTENFLLSRVLTVARSEEMY